MKKLIVVLLVAYIASLCYFFFIDRIFKTEVEQWNAYKEVAFNYSLNKNKKFHCIKSNFNHYFIVGLGGNYTQDDFNAIDSWVQQLNLLVGPPSIVIDLGSKPESSNLYFSFISSDSGGLSKEKTAVYSTQIFENRAESGIKVYSANDLNTYPPAKPGITKIEISTKYTNQALRNFIIKQSFLYSLGIFKNNIELSNYLNIIISTKIEFSRKYRYTEINLIRDIDFRKLTIEFDNNFNSTFKWENLLNKIQSKTGVVIKVSDIKAFSDPNFYNKFSNLGLFTTKGAFTTLDKYIIENYVPNKYLQLYNFNIQNEFPRKVEDITFVVIIIALILFIILIILSYSVGYFDKIATFIVRPKNKHTLLYFNLRDLIPVLLLLMYNFPISVLHDGKAHLNYKQIVFFIEIILSLNLVYIFEKYVFVKPKQFFKQQTISLFILPLGVLLISLIINTFLQKHNDIRLSLGLSLACLIIAILRFLYNISVYQKKLQAEARNQEINRLKELKTRAELNALQSRINPHFLYNSLNSIASLAHGNPEKVEQMALALSKLFRYCINKDESDFECIKNEVEMALIYLEIEKVRFGEKLEYSVILPKEMEETMIPKFLIQPLVENAIKHGVSNYPEAGQIKLEIARKQNEIEITVYDNGPDFPEDFVTGYGLQSIYEKLDILYPDSYSVNIQNKPEKNIRIVLKGLKVL